MMTSLPSTTHLGVLGPRNTLSLQSSSLSTSRSYSAFRNATGSLLDISSPLWQKGDLRSLLGANEVHALLYVPDGARMSDYRCKFVRETLPPEDSVHLVPCPKHLPSRYAEHGG